MDHRADPSRGDFCLTKQYFELEGKRVPSKAQRIAILLPSLAGGGAERSMLLLCQFFSQQGRAVDLLLCRPEGAYAGSVPPAVSVVTLKPSSSLRGRLLALLADPAGLVPLLKPVLLPIKADANIRHIDALATYLKDNNPNILLSAMTYTNLVALWARRLAGNNVPVVVSERIALTVHIQNQSVKDAWRWKYLLPLVNQAYQAASGIVTVSNGVAKDLIENTGIAPKYVKTIYNPVVDDQLGELAAQPLQHPWFDAESPPVILGAGRLIPQKDFATLLRAFAQLRQRRPARLMILGEGRLRPELEGLAETLGVAADVAFPGFVQNPYQYMARAAAFVLASLYEGLPGVLIQALACGCPVVSTDCPGGSEEILDYGKYGTLTPVGDAAAIAGALNAALDAPPDRDALMRRAQVFSVDTAAQRYLEYLDGVVEQDARSDG
jgi:glycosyltransferase involved in cell wall biosynthesis